MARPLHIGLDLDNTIVDYDQAFGEVGVSTGILSAGHGMPGKAQIKDHLLSQSGGMETWMRLQGQVYGPFMQAAVPFDGSISFIRGMLECGNKVTIISHKTKFGHFDETRTSLWDAARSWLGANGIVANTPGGLFDQDVIFAETREEKIGQIVKAGCDIFIDDLLEVLQHPDFPETVRRIWFVGRAESISTAGLRAFPNWGEISAALTG